jgi:hypothetical protein
MAAQHAVSAQQEETIREYDDIARVVQLYMDGSARGDVAKLKEAFHPDARMFGSLAGTRYDVPIQELFKMAEGQPADADGSYRGRLVSVERVGDAAMATVAEDGYWGHGVSFVDFFSLARINGTWKIVNKTFAHTGGEMPAS